MWSRLTIRPESRSASSVVFDDCVIVLVTFCNVSVWVCFIWGQVELVRHFVVFIVSQIRETL